MQQVRPAAVAGLFYPDSAAELQRQIEHFLVEANEKVGSSSTWPKAIIAPHAGYVYSGPIAASVYARLLPAKGHIRRVILLGPAHRVPLRGLALPSVEGFITPLGVVPIDTEALPALDALSQVQVSDLAHEQEHSLEVHLPFLQTVLGEFHLVPLVVGEASASEVAQVLKALWQDDNCLIVISSDLSHYHDYASAQRMDKATSEAIEALDYEAIHYGDACGRNPVSGLLALAREWGWHAHTIDVRNSGDTAGSRDQVVGYGAYVVD